MCIRDRNKLSDNERAKGIELKPGDVKWKDVNGDGVIDQYDQVVIGNTTPVSYTHLMSLRESWVKCIM